MDINALVNITSRAWSLTILHLMHSGTPGRQAPLLAASGASRSSFTNSLAHLIELGLLERNPGHGHPLRPEYRMTNHGTHCAQMATEILNAVPDDPALLRRIWTIPILAISHQPRHFIQIKRALPAITDRALSQSLQNLQTQHWLTRTLDPAAHTPRPIYHAANQGLAIAQAALPYTSPP